MFPINIKFKGKALALFTGGAMLMFSLFFNYQLYEKTKSYELFFSKELERSIAKIITSSSSSQQIIDEMIRTGEVTKDNSRELTIYLGSFTANVDKVLQLDHTLNQLDEGKDWYKILESFSMLQMYMDKINDRITKSEDQTYPLNDNQKNILSKANLVLEQYMITAENVIGGVDQEGITGDYKLIYQRDMIQTDSWALFLKEMQQITEDKQLLKEVYHFFDSV
ncbi:MAG: hypothetical protein H0Z32_03370 [Bacillaceae bacterium]|nr:hypothetical protein [Bacillaceae bacterium]